MKKYIILIVVLVASFTIKAQKDFQIIKEIQATTVKNQSRSGTCWSFATLSFIESELIRMGKGEFDFSEMYMVRYAYEQKTLNYLLKQGKTNFSSGGQSHDVTNVIKTHGIVPETAYRGLNYGSALHNHKELDTELRKIVKSSLKEKEAIGEVLFEVRSVLDSFLGKAPQNFIYEGNTFTPVEFRKHIGLNTDDFIEITSFLHMPFYEQVNLQIPDNWSGDQYYNVPLEDMMRVINHALNNGYTMCWDGDVSGGFNRSKGIAEEKEEKAVVDQELREERFLDFTTTDDHLMHVTGIAKDRDGNIYYMTKNSWGKTGKYDGYWYMSENYVKMNTVAIMIHKDALPEDIARKFSFK